MTSKPYSLFRAIFTLLLLVLWVICSVTLFFLTKLFRPRQLSKIPMLFHRGCCRLFRLKVQCQGEMHRSRPALYVSNHISYLDIFVLGGIVPGCFIAKSEVAGWPLLGRLAQLQNTLFFERRGSRARSQVNIMQNQLRSDGNLILFPEGTSTDGAHVEPFKSTLFHAAEMEHDKLVYIQPVTVSYTNWQQKPMPQSIRDYFAWYASMPFASHFFKMLGMGGADVELIFHAPVQLGDFESRKACAEHCQQQVAKALAQSLTPTRNDEIKNNEQTVPVQH